MKKVLFVLLCVAAIAIIPACKRFTCKKEEAPMVPQMASELPAAPTAPTAPMPAPAQ